METTPPQALAWSPALAASPVAATGEAAGVVVLAVWLDVLASAEAAAW